MISYFLQGSLIFCSTGLQLSEVDKSQPVFGMMRSKGKWGRIGRNSTPFATQPCANLPHSLLCSYGGWYVLGHSLWSNYHIFQWSSIHNCSTLRNDLTIELQNAHHWKGRVGDSHDVLVISGPVFHNHFYLAQFQSANEHRLLFDQWGRSKHEH